MKARGGNGALQREVTAYEDYRSAQGWEELASTIEAAWRSGFGGIPLVAQVVIANIRRGGRR